MLAQESHRSLNLRPPDKAQGSGRPLQLAASDQAVEHPRRLKDGHAPARIVVRSRPLMVEMAAIDHLACVRVRARYGCRHHCPVPARHLRLHVRAQHHRPPTRELCPQRRSRSSRHHKCKPVWQQRIQMAPAHNTSVDPRPRRRLVRHVAHDPCRSVLHHRHALHRRQHSIGKNNIPSHVLVRVVRFACSLAHID